MPRKSVKASTSSESRRGRPRAGQRLGREQAVLDAVLDELTENGFDKVTMLSVAQRAGASKETLYTWFGNREGLFEAVIRYNADLSAAKVAHALQADADAQDTLVSYAVGLLKLLSSDASVQMNRAAMKSPRLAQLLLQHGRYRVGPLVEEYLASLHADGKFQFPDPPAAFRLLYGLVVEDSQIRVLLGEKPPSANYINKHAKIAVGRFFVLTQVDSE